MNRSTLRTSRRLRRCNCGTIIMPGDQYLEQVISPDHGDVGNAGWWRADECSVIAASLHRSGWANGRTGRRTLGMCGDRVATPDGWTGRVEVQYGSFSWVVIDGINVLRTYATATLKVVDNPDGK